jgi:hypothetical protein
MPKAKRTWIQVEISMGTITITILVAITITSLGYLEEHHVTETILVDVAGTWIEEAIEEEEDGRRNRKRTDNGHRVCRHREDAGETAVVVAVDRRHHLTIAEMEMEMEITLHHLIADVGETVAVVATIAGTRHHHLIAEMEMEMAPTKDGAVMAVAVSLPSPATTRTMRVVTRSRSSKIIIAKATIPPRVKRRTTTTTTTIPPRPKTTAPKTTTGGRQSSQRKTQKATRRCHHGIRLQRMASARGKYISIQ